MNNTWPFCSFVFVMVALQITNLIFNIVIKVELDDIHDVVSPSASAACLEPAKVIAAIGVAAIGKYIAGQ